MLSHPVLNHTIRRTGHFPHGQCVVVTDRDLEVSPLPNFDPPRMEQLNTSGAAPRCRWDEDAPGSPLGHFKLAEVHDMALTEVSNVLWRERELLEMLLFKLEEEQLLLTAGRTRWLPHATR